MHNGSAREHLRQELAAARAALARDAHAAIEDAHTLADWRHHFRAHPWLCCGGAAIVGYLLVPARHTVKFVPQFEKLREAMTERVQSNDAPAAATKGALATLAGLGGTFLARQALNYATRRGMEWLQQRSQPRPPEAWQYGSMAAGEPEDYTND
jgi:hypothetical protein